MTIGSNDSAVSGGSGYVIANGSEEQEFGADRLHETLLRWANEEPATVASRVLDVVSTFERGVHAADDKTVVVLRRSWGSIACVTVFPPEDQ